MRGNAVHIAQGRHAGVESAYLHESLLPGVYLPGHICLLSSRSCCNEIIKGPLLLAEVKDLSQCAVANVWKRHYKQL